MSLRIIQLGRAARSKVPSRRARWLGLLAALFAGARPRRQAPVTGDDLKRSDFASSTQRLGVRFSERLRAAFRHRWLKEVK